MAKHDKKPRCGEFNIAVKPLCLFGCPHGNNSHPFKVPAGAWYGRDYRGYWVFFDPFSEFKNLPKYEVWRYSAENRKWQRVIENNTSVCRLIREKLNTIPVKSADMLKRLQMDKDDRRSLSKIPNSEKRYINPRSMNKAYRHEVAEREKEWCKINVHPSEKSFSLLDYVM